MDAAIQVGFPNEELFPQRGDSITYYVNGEKRMVRGEAGEAAVILLNGKETGINTPIELNDKIEIKSSTKGVAAEITVDKLPEIKSSLSFSFNDRKVTCARFVSVNGELVSEFYSIKDNDQIELLDYYTLEQVLEFMDITQYGKILVNNMPADMNTKVYDNFTIVCDMEEQLPQSYVNETYETEESGNDYSMLDELVAEEKEPEVPVKVPYTGGPRNISITVNGQPVVLSNKANYILVDVLDFYPVDTSVAHGERLDLEVNGMACDFTHPVEPGDIVRIEWV